MPLTLPDWDRARACALGFRLSTRQYHEVMRVPHELTTVLLARRDPEVVSAAERTVKLVDGQIESEQTQEG